MAGLQQRDAALGNLGLLRIMSNCILGVGFWVVLQEYVCHLVLMILVKKFNFYKLVEEA